MIVLGIVGYVLFTSSSDDVESNSKPLIPNLHSWNGEIMCRIGEDECQICKDNGIGASGFPCDLDYRLMHCNGKTDCTWLKFKEENIIFNAQFVAVTLLGTSKNMTEIVLNGMFKIIFYVFHFNFIISDCKSNNWLEYPK